MVKALADSAVNALRFGLDLPEAVTQMGRDLILLADMLSPHGVVPPLSPPHSTILAAMEVPH